MTATVTNLPRKMVVTDDDAKVVLACPVNEQHSANEFGLTTVLWDHPDECYEDADPMVIFGVFCHDCDTEFVDRDLLDEARSKLLNY